MTIIQRAWTFQRGLTLATLLSVVLVLPPLIGMLVDPKAIGGVNGWIKPLKFAMASAIYAASFLWLLTFVRGRSRLVNVLGNVTGFALLLEVALITMQVSRGTISHFNAATPFDAAVFSVMGAAITVLASMNLVLAVLLFRQPVPDQALGAGIRIGVIASFLGMAVAFLMPSPTPEQLEAIQAGAQVAAIGAHSVGVPDGGPGLPFFGWSLEGGDLRVPHFVGIHGMQALAVLGWLLALPIARRRWDDGTRLTFVRIGGAAYIGWLFLLTWQALRGQSVVAPDVSTLLAYAALAGASLVALLIAASRATSPGMPNGSNDGSQVKTERTYDTMKPATHTLIALMLLAASPLGSVQAQERQPLELTIEPAAPPEITYEQFRIEELERGALRSRNALIGTSVAAAVGLALVIPAASQCESVESNGNKDYECSRAGSALYGVGSPLLIGGLTGAVVSGIILGVRKGKLRRLNDTFTYPRARAFRWDERSSRFVF